MQASVLRQPLVFLQHGVRKKDCGITQCLTFYVFLAGATFVRYTAPSSAKVLFDFVYIRQVSVLLTCYHIESLYFQDVFNIRVITKC